MKISRRNCEQRKYKFSKVFQVFNFVIDLRYSFNENYDAKYEGIGYVRSERNRGYTYIIHGLTSN